MLNKKSNWFYSVSFGKINFQNEFLRKGSRNPGSRTTLVVPNLTVTRILGVLNRLIGGEFHGYEKFTSLDKVKDFSICHEFYGHFYVAI